MWCRPPASGTAAVMASWPRVRVTSVISSRIRRLRSRIGVAGLFHRAGKSAARARMRPRRCSSIRAVAVLAVGVLVLGGGQPPLTGVPVGFEGIGDEPGRRVDGQVAAPGLVEPRAGRAGRGQPGSRRLARLAWTSSSLTVRATCRASGASAPRISSLIAVSTVSAAYAPADRLSGPDAVILADGVRHDRVIGAGVVAHCHPPPGFLPQTTRPWSRAGPSRGGPALRSWPRAAALPVSTCRLAW